METFRSFDGLEIAYLDAGHGPAVILSHGFAADHRINWVVPGVVDALVAAGRRVVAPDARGHGRSAKPHDPEAYAGDAMGRDIQALLDHLGLTQVDVVGYSMGSLVSARLVPLEPRAHSLILGGVGGRMGQVRRPANRGAIARAHGGGRLRAPSTIPEPGPSGNSPSARGPTAWPWRPSSGRRPPNRRHSGTSPCRPWSSPVTPMCWSARPMSWPGRFPAPPTSCSMGTT